MPVSKAQQKAVNKYMAANYDRINLTVPKGKKENIQGYAAAAGESVNGYINKAIDDRIAREAAGSLQDGREGPTGAGVVSLPTEGEKAAQRTAAGE